MLGNGDLRLEGGLSCDSLQIRMKGGGDLLISGISSDAIDLKSEWHRSIKLSGTSSSAMFDLSDRNSLHIEDLKATRLKVNERQPDTESVRVAQAHEALLLKRP